MSTSKVGNSLSEIARKVFLSGLGAIFMTEETVRQLLNEIKLPKEAMGYVVGQAKKQKEELISTIATELANFFSKIKVHEEIRKALSSMEIHVQTKLTFNPRGEASAHAIEVGVQSKRKK